MTWRLGRFPNAAKRDRKQDTPSGTAANTSTDASQPETFDEQTQPKATVAEQPRAHQAEHHCDHGGQDT